MVNGRLLIQGIKPEEEIDPDMAEDFIAGRKPRKQPKPSQPASQAIDTTTMETPPLPPEPPPDQPSAQPSAARPQPAAATAAPDPLLGVGRVLVGARVRTELAAALKRASLERQLQGIEPNSVQDILEESIELWLVKHRPTR
jgi:hypothetical protein